MSKSLEVIPSSPQPSAHIDIDRGNVLITDESQRELSVADVGGISRSSGMFQISEIPGYAGITHSAAPLEVFLPTYSRHLIDKTGKTPLESIPGRIMDIHIEETVPSTGAADTHVMKLAIVDEAMMPGELGMKADQQQAKSQGKASIFDLLVDKPRDAFFLWELDRNRQRADGKLGEWVLRSVIGPDAHPEDIFLQKATPAMSVRSQEDTYEYEEIFLDELSIGSPKSAENPYNKVRNPLTREGRAFYAGVSKTILDPTYNFKDDKEHRLLRHNSGVQAAVTEMLRFIKAHDGSIAEPARIFIRAYALFGEIDELEKSRGHKSKQGFNIQRQQVWESVKAAGLYLTRLEGVALQDAADKKTAEEDPETRGAAEHMGTSLRAEFIALDDIDTSVARQLARVVHLQDEYSGVRKELLQHLRYNRDRETTFAARSLNASVRFFADTSPTSSKGQELKEYQYDGRPLPYAVRTGHYIDEIIESLVNPRIDSPAFPTNGLAMSGVVGVFDVSTSEHAADAQEPLPPRIMVTSAKEQPWKLTEKILGEYLSPKRTPESIGKLLSGAVGLTQLMVEPRTQVWRVVREEGKDIRVGRQRFTNGNAFALARDSSGNIYDDFGNVSGQKPKKRTLVTKRSMPRGSNDVSIKWHIPQTGSLPVSATTPEGEALHAKIDNIQVSAVFAHDGVYVKDNTGSDISVMVGKQFRRLIPKKEAKERVRIQHGA
jgi:hypothetical protein